MEGNTKRNGMALRLLFASAIIVAAIAIVLTWQQPAHERAEAAGGGPEMALSVKSGTTTCPLGTGPDTACVMAGDPFTLAVEAVGIPALGYILAQTFIDFGTFNPGASEDGGAPGTCDDGGDNGDADGADRRDTDCVTVDLIYKPVPIEPTATPPTGAFDEIVWPDLEPSLALRDLTLAPATALHGGLSGLISPPPSFFLGNLLLLDFNCSASSSSTLVQLLPEGDALAGTSGSLYTEPPSTQVIPKVDTLTVKCVGPTPTPTDTPIPPTATFTVSPTPTDTPTPLPPPSERPDVKVTKVDLVDPVDSGGSISYQIEVKSIGLQTAENVVVEDTLPAGSVFKSATSAGATCNHAAGVVTCDVTNDMAPMALIKISVTINAPTPVTDSLVDNTVTVTSSNEPFANTANNKDIEQTMVLAPRSDVILSKVGDPTFLDGGEDVTYTLVAKNLGPNPAQNVQIVDTLPANATFVSATNPECGAPIGGEVTCDLGKLAPGAEAIVQIVLTAPNVTRSIFLKNAAFVSADNELFLQTGNNLAVENTAVIAPPPDLVISKTDSQDPVLRLGFYSYEITVLNQGLGDALDVVVTDTLPFATIVLAQTHTSAATFESAVGATCQAIPGDQVECTIDEINASQQVVITINVRAPTLLEDENVINSVTVSASDPDENPAGNDASEATLVRACFDVTGDLIVDLPNDILGVILVLGLREGDIGYDVIYDFEGDGFIGLPNDLLPVLLHFLQDCSLLL
ncbi:MAG: DUF11 domain-containing protein [Chloroflexi bacterium]|nr:DUF11 domain-containing protein [Chloroflexota bacterium]